MHPTKPCNAPNKPRFMLRTDMHFIMSMQKEAYDKSSKDGKQQEQETGREQKKNWCEKIQ
jgi:hypothetical protein